MSAERAGYSYVGGQPAREMNNPAAMPPPYSQPPNTIHPTPGYQPYPPGAVYPQSQMQQSSNTTVVMSQPSYTPVVTTVQRPPSNPGYGIVALVLSIITIFGVFFMGCWWTLPCTIVGLVLGITSTTHGDAGDVSTSKTHAWISLGFTIFSWVFSVVGVIIIVGAIVGVVRSNSCDYYYDYYC